MNWLNINIQTLDSENFLGSDPVERGTWLCLLRYCIGQENGGTITGCADWPDRKWQQLVRITKRESIRDCDLWTWDGDDLTVWGYPIDKEEEIKHLRAIGKQTSDAKKAAAKANGKRGGRPTKNPTENPTETEQETQTKPIERKGKEIEGKGIERESAGASSRPDPIASQAQQIVAAYPRREKVADALAVIHDHLMDGESFEAMLAGTKAAAAVIRTLPSGASNRYVPGAEAFFKSKRWADDPETLKRQGNAKSGTSAMSDDELVAALGGRAVNLD
jgi:hypothetical protein